ncbi:MAG: hypothetical protein DHS20C03_08960 [Minwuia thermotolerans]|nr:MAG: hypothetical protein DHS20C03_08960 [Minwuia thermotolerans]
MEDPARSGGLTDGGSGPDGRATRTARRESTQSTTPVRRSGGHPPAGAASGIEARKGQDGRLARLAWFTRARPTPNLTGV